MSSDHANPHDPAHIPMQLAELIGQTQHLIELQEALIGKNVYDPIIIDLSAGTSQEVNLPAEACQIETIQVSGDTAGTISFYRVGGDTNGPTGKKIGQVYMPANNVAPPLVLNAPVPPGYNNQLIVTTSTAIAHGSCVITLCRTRLGGYPYAG